MMSERNKGIAYIILAAFFFSLMGLFIRLAGELPTMEKALFRNLVAVIISTVMLLRNRGSLGITKAVMPDVILRAFFGTVGLVCNFYAIDHLNMSDANVLNKLSPFFAILMSIFVLKEKAHKWEWLAVFVAFGGALLVIKPGISMSTGPALVGLLGGCSAGTAYTFLRKAGTKGVKGSFIVFFFSVFSTVVILPFFILQYEPMRPEQLLFCLLTGAAASGGQLCITAAYTHAPAKEISLYDYTQVIFAAIWGFFLLGQIPDWLSILGYVLILAAAVIRFLHGLRKENA